MRVLILISMLLLVSCGKSTSSHDNIPQSQEGIIDGITPTDFLEVSLELPVEISEDKIYFKKGGVDRMDGTKSHCSLALTSGESYSYELTGATLKIFTSSGENYTYQRANPGDGIVGSWSLKNYENGTLYFRRITFVGMEKMILNIRCET